MLPSLRIRTTGKAIARAMQQSLDMARGAVPGATLLPSQLSQETRRALTTPVTDEASGLYWLRHLDALLNGRETGGLLYRRVDASFFQERQWLRNVPVNPALPPGDLGLMTPTFPGELVRRLLDLFRTEEKISRDDVQVSSILLKSFSGRRDRLGVVNWMALQGRVARLVLDYSRGVERWLAARRDGA
jgi:hypothetical protein